jgi:hypothetical protein
VFNSEFDPYDEIVKCQERIMILEDLVNQLIESNNEQAKVLEQTAHTFSQISKIVFHNQSRINDMLLKP